jgi:hypothetical protein
MRAGSEREKTMMKKIVHDPEGVYATGGDYHGRSTTGWGGATTKTISRPGAPA